MYEKWNHLWDCCCIDGSIASIERELKEKAAAIVATGEAAKYIVPHCGRNMFLDENLLLKGLKLIYEKNQNSALDGGFKYNRIQTDDLTG